MEFNGIWHATLRKGFNTGDVHPQNTSAVESVSAVESLFLAQSESASLARIALHKAWNMPGDAWSKILQQCDIDAAHLPAGHRSSQICSTVLRQLHVPHALLPYCLLTLPPLRGHGPSSKALRAALMAASTSSRSAGGQEAGSAAEQDMVLKPWKFLLQCIASANWHRFIAMKRLPVLVFAIASSCDQA